MSYDENDPGAMTAEKKESKLTPQQELTIAAESIGVTPAKLKAMREYAGLLRQQDKRIKESTIRRKICEKFKVKLV